VTGSVTIAYFVSARVTFPPFTDIQGHWFWCQLKARMSLPISTYYVIVTLVLSCTVSEISQLLYAPDPTLFHPNFGVFPLHQIAHVEVSKRIGLKLLGSEIIFEVLQPVWKTYLNVTDGQTDGQTDDLLSHNRALRSIARYKCAKLEPGTQHMMLPELPIRIPHPTTHSIQLEACSASFLVSLVPLQSWVLLQLTATLYTNSIWCASFQQDDRSFMTTPPRRITHFSLTWKQEAQLPQRNSASAAHMKEGGLGPPADSPAAPSGYIYAYMVESETRNKRTSSVPSTKRTLRWIGHSRSFKVILIGAGVNTGRNTERCVVVMCN